MRNLITDVPGIAVGNAADRRVRTGVTAIVPDRRARAAASVMGGAPGTRETDMLRPESTIEHVDAIMLSGGSAFGLAASDGAMEFLAARGRGVQLRGQTVPIAPAAILFDLANGGDKTRRPYRALGSRAIASAGADFALGNAGAGYGALAGGYKGGLGSASIKLGRFALGALAAVNSMGDVVIPGSAAFWAAPFEREREFGGVALPAPGLPARFTPQKHLAPANTTIAVVATDLDLTVVQLARLALMAQDGLARAIRPAHSAMDGDTVFALSTARVRPRGDDFLQACVAAGDCLARAIARGVYEARALGGFKAYRDRHGLARNDAPRPQSRQTGRHR